MHTRQASYWIIIISVEISIVEYGEVEGNQPVVLVTEFCPRNSTEWKRRSSSLNCTESNGYMCIPNENLTRLLEFCYNYPRIPIEKGVCLIMNQRRFLVDDRSCNHFIEGCPSKIYWSSEIYKFSSCLSIGNGCFLADPSCEINGTKSMTKRKKSYRSPAWIFIIMAVMLPLFAVAVSTYFLLQKQKRKQKNNHEDKLCLYMTISIKAKSRSKDSNVHKLCEILREHMEAMIDAINEQSPERDIDRIQGAFVKYFTKITNDVEKEWAHQLLSKMTKRVHFFAQSKQENQVNILEIFSNFSNIFKQENATVNLHYSDLCFSLDIHFDSEERRNRFMNKNKGEVLKQRIEDICTEPVILLTAGLRINDITIDIRVSNKEGSSNNESQKSNEGEESEPLLLEKQERSSITVAGDGIGTHIETKHIRLKETRSPPAWKTDISGRGLYI